MCLFEKITFFFVVVCLSRIILVVSTRLDIPEFHAVVTPGLKTLATTFEKHGFKRDEIRIVGGSVRDILSSKEPTDVDLATSATLQEMKDMFNAEGIHMFNQNGERHGTISVRINKSECFEISTLRSEIKRDGQIINNSFSKNWLVDATQRDFTINAIYLDLEGNLYDYHNGYEDLKNNRVVFIGEPDERIKKDPFRILRYFRIFGKITNDPHSHDEKILQAIRDNAFRLNNILGERIWSELQGIFSGNFANEIVKTMLELGLAPHIGLGNPADLDITCFDFVCRNAKKYKFRPITLIASLFRTKDQVTAFKTRLKISIFDRSLCCFIVKHKNDTLPESDEDCFKYFQIMLVGAHKNQDSMREFMIEFLKLVDREGALNLFSGWIMPVFWIDKKVLKAAKRAMKSEQVGPFMSKLKEKWFDNDFVLTDNIITRVANEFKNPN